MPETIDRLEDLLRSKGIKIFARLDQAAEVQAVSFSLDFLLRPNAMQQRLSAFWPKRSAKQTIRRRESSTPTSMPLYLAGDCPTQKPRLLWRRTANIDRCTTSGNVLEEDHRAIKRRVRASQHSRSFWGAWRTIAGYEAIHMIRKGQACGSAIGTGSGLLHRFVLGMFGIEV